MLNDLTRCLGVGNAGTFCLRRLECQRYLTIDEDASNDAKTDRCPFRSFAAMLCRPPNMAYFWPVDGSQSMAERMRNKGYQPVPDAALRAVMGGSVSLDEDVETNA
jgi:hypothetical protein